MITLEEWGCTVMCAGAAEAAGAASDGVARVAFSDTHTIQSSVQNITFRYHFFSPLIKYLRVKPCNRLSGTITVFE